jgi:hypothetical protein
LATRKFPSNRARCISDLIKNLISASDHTDDVNAAYFATVAMKDLASLANPPNVSTMNGINSAPSACANAANFLVFSCAAFSAALKEPWQAVST